MSARAAASFQERSRGAGAGAGGAGSAPLMQQVYGRPSSEPAAVRKKIPLGGAGVLWDEDDEPPASSPQRDGSGSVNAEEDSSRVQAAPQAAWSEEDVQELLRSIRNKFVTGDWSRANQRSESSVAAETEGK
jgi:ribosome biogenesis protein BMS1